MVKRIHKPSDEETMLLSKGPTKDIAMIRAKLNHLTMKWKPTSWLDTGFPDLNEVMGDRELGMAYSQVVEVSGLESQGKTALMAALSGIGQQEGADVLWGDLESSWRDKWMAQRGLDPSKVHLFQPYVGKFTFMRKGKLVHEKTSRLITAQELLQEVEDTAGLLYRRGSRKMIIVIDSIASMLVEGEAIAGLVGGSGLKSKQALPEFMGRLMRRWVGLAQSYGAILLFVNQLRQNPMQGYGDPWYTPGGNAVRFFSHVRVRVRRTKGSRIIKKGKVVGIKGLIKNMKNKIGGVEQSQVGFKLYFDGPLEFVSAKEVENADGTKSE